jgi:two-component system sensor histidine kinase QseC
MSLRLRLLLLIGVSLSLLWGGMAWWMQHNLERQLRISLDQRLEMAAEMVAGLVGENPDLWQSAAARGTQLGLPRAGGIAAPLGENGLVCEISSVRGQVVSATPGVPAAGLPTSGRGFSERVIAGRPWRTFTIAAHGMVITTADLMAERQGLMRTVMLAAALPFAVALVGGLLVLWLGAGRALQPLERLRQMLAARAPDALDPVPAAATPRDLRPFVATLNDMLQRIAATFSRERRFTSDAAHELRTPLTAIKLHLQVLRLSRGDDAAQALDHAQEGVARMQHTMEQLLTLARIEGPCSWDDEEAADAAQVARLAMRDAAGADTQRIALHDDGADARLALPQALAVTALRNLLDNALRHGPAQGTTHLTLEASGGQVSFTVRDAGPGMTDEELARATERFWRRGEGGSGLGLSIVQAIATRVGGALALRSHPGGGLEARLSLPRRS